MPPPNTVDILLQIRSDVRAMQQVQQGLAGVTQQVRTLGSVARLAPAFAAVGLGMSSLTGEILAAVTASQAMAASLADVRDRLQIRPEIFQTLAATARDAGGSVEGLTDIVGHLRRSVAQARAGDQGKLGALELLGIDPKGFAQLPIEQQLESVGRALVTARDQTTAYAATVELLGRGATANLGTLRALGEDGFGALAERARETRGVLQDGVVAQLDDLGDRAEAAGEKLGKSFAGWNVRLLEAKATLAEFMAKHAELLRASGVGLGAGAALAISAPAIRAIATAGALLWEQAMVVGVVKAAGQVPTLAQATMGPGMARLGGALGLTFWGALAAGGAYFIARAIEEGLERANKRLLAASKPIDTSLALAREVPGLRTEEERLDLLRRANEELQRQQEREASLIKLRDLAPVAQRAAAVAGGGTAIPAAAGEIFGETQQQELGAVQAAMKDLQALRTRLADWRPPATKPPEGREFGPDDEEAARLAVLRDAVTLHIQENDLITEKFRLQYEGQPRLEALLEEQLGIEENLIQARRDLTAEFRASLSQDEARRLELQDKTDLLAVERKRLEIVQRQADAEKRKREEQRAEEDRARGGSYVGRTEDRLKQYEASARYDDEAGVGGGLVAGWKNALMDLGTVAQQAGSMIQNVVGGAISNVSAGITGLVMRTMSWGQALRNIGGSIIQTVIDGLVRMFSAWIAQRLLLKGANVAADTTEAAAKAPKTLMESISSWGIAAAVGAAAFLAAMALTGSFRSGGYTGAGAPDAPAGIVHRGEYVFAAPEVERIGVPALRRLATGESAVVAPLEIGGQPFDLPLGGARVAGQAEVGRSNFAAALQVLQGFESGGYVGDGAGPRGMSSALSDRLALALDVPALDVAASPYAPEASRPSQPGRGRRDREPETRLILVDERRSAEQLARDPRFRNVILDITGGA